MKSSPRRANHHEDFNLKSFSETPWNQSNHSIAKKQFHFLLDLMNDNGA
jgi:hypothetical protein